MDTNIQQLISVFEDIELNEQQVEALNKFFELHKEKLKNQLKAEILESIESDIDLSQYVKIEDAEKAFDLFKSDCERAFELFENDCERAFELFENDCEKAFELAQDDLKNQYTQQLAKAIEEIYEDIEQRVYKDFLESKEYKTIQEIKNIILPLFEEDSHELIAKIKQITEEKQHIEQENKQLIKEKTISILMKDIPEQYYSVVENFISKGDTEEDIIERFNSILEAIEIKETQKTKNNKIQYDINDESEKIYDIKKQNKKRFAKKQKIDEIIKENKKASFNEEFDNIFKYETKIDYNDKEFNKYKNNLQPFTEDEYKLLQRVMW